MKLTIEIDNLTEAQAIAIEDLMNRWYTNGEMGHSEWTGFYSDGDGNFRPEIKVNGHKPKETNIISYEKKENIELYNGILPYGIDFDWLAWAIDKNK